MTLRRLGVAAACSAALGGATMAMETRLQAMDYLAAALPLATSENPKYLTKADGTISQWLTKEVRFATDANGSVVVTMRESYFQSKNGTTTPGAHEATFAMTDVTISEFTEAGDVTPAGAASRGVMFACKAPGCISAVWGDKPSRADKTDVSIQADDTRAKIMAAFRRLQAP